MKKKCLKVLTITVHRKKMILSSKYSTPEGFSPNSIYAVLEFSDSLSKVFLYNLTKNNFESHSLNTAGISSYFNEIKVLREQIDSCWLVLLRYCIREDNQCNFKEYLFIELHNLKKKKIDRKIKIALGDDFEQNTERVFTGGKKIFIFYPKKVLIVDMEKLKVKIVNFDDELWGTSCTPCCVSRDGKWIARFPFQNEKIKNGKKFVAKVYEAESGKLYSEIPVNCQRSVKYLALAPDKELLAIGFRRNLKSQGKIILYNINTKREIRELKLEI